MSLILLICKRNINSVITSRYTAHLIQNKIWSSQNLMTLQKISETQQISNYIFDLYYWRIELLNDILDSLLFWNQSVIDIKRVAKNHINLWRRNFHNSNLLKLGIMINSTIIGLPLTNLDNDADFLAIGLVMSPVLWNFICWISKGSFEK